MLKHISAFAAAAPVKCHEGACLQVTGAGRPRRSCAPRHPRYEPHCHTASLLPLILVLLLPRVVLVLLLQRRLLLLLRGVRACIVLLRLLLLLLVGIGARRAGGCSILLLPLWRLRPIGRGRRIAAAMVGLLHLWGCSCPVAALLVARLLLLLLVGHGRRRGVAAKAAAAVLGVGCRLLLEILSIVGRLRVV